MTRKTGSKTLKARQLMKAAKKAKQLREMKEEGVLLETPKPDKELVKQKEEEFEKLYLELAGQQEGEETSSEEATESEETSGSEGEVSQEE
jgi:hypothetical protein